LPEGPTESFKTHSNYIRAFSLLVYDPISSSLRNMYACLKDRIHQSNALPPTRNTNIDLAQVRSRLHAAWGTETLLLMTRRIVNEEELLRLSNNWSCIQVYYIFYHCTQALHVAKGHPRPENHPRTQNIFNDYWAGRSVILPPWSLAYGRSGTINTPPGIAPEVTIHQWTVCEGTNIWSLACKALMTTRREALEEKYREKRESMRRQNRQAWRQEENDRLARGRKARKQPDFRLPKLTSSEKERINESLRSYTFMDYLYRLRLKTNYEDSNMFSDGPENNNSSRYIRDALCRISNGTLFLHELAIRNLVGRDSFLTWIDEWVHRNMPQNTTHGLGFRRRYLER
jgi:hypothetical protein